MQNLVLTLIDTTGIQDYIFGSNRLRENIGASELVEQATRQWPLECLVQLGSHNLDVSNLEIDDAKRIDENSLDAELVYAGGGNTAIIFADMGKAQAFASAYSQMLIAQAPDLRVVLIHHEFPWSTTKNTIKQAFTDAYGKLAERKAAATVSMPLLGLGVTAACDSTGMPATGYDAVELNQRPGNEWKYRAIASGVQAKLDYVRDANVRLRKWDSLRWGDFGLPLDFDDFGREKGENSYIAIVHADGNGMGLLFQKALETGGNNRAAIDTYRKLSKAVDSAGQSAIESVASVLVDQENLWESDDGEWLLGDQKTGNYITLSKKYYIPFRPLVYGGDDVTFVCDGRLGLTLATIYLGAFEKAAQEHVVAVSQAFAPEVQTIRACAGIAIVKTHYPFARAYDLAEDLCQNAKMYVRDASASRIVSDFSALDWHLATGGLYGDIDVIRQREYTVNDGTLSIRPLALNKNVQTAAWRTWPVFKRTVHQLTSGSWKEKHNKVVRLRDALRQGAAATSQFVTAFAPEGLPDLGHPEFSQQGWRGAECGYFDVVEALDYCIPLKAEQ